MSKDEGRTLKLLKAGLPVLAAAGTMGALGLAREKFQGSKVFSPKAADVLGPQESGEIGSEIGSEVGDEVSGEVESDAARFRPRDQWFLTADGVKLHGWWIPHVTARCAVLYCHGKNGSLGQWIEALAHLHSLGVAVLAFDYRGYGYSAGKPSESGVFRDVRAAYQHLRGPLAVAAEETVIFGHSLGGAVAIDAAMTQDAAGLVVQSTFTDLRAMARSRYPKLPLHWLTRNQFKNIRKVRSLSLPKLFIHGGADNMVPVAMGQELFRQAREPKRFLEVPGGGHNDLHRLGGRSYDQALTTFFDECMAAAAGG